MRRTTATMAALALFVFASTVIGQEGDQSENTSHDQLRDYAAARIGVWEGEITLDVDTPGLGEKGDTLIGRVTIDWILKKTALEARWRLGKVQGRAITVWDAAAKQIKTRFTTSGGMVGDTTVQWDGEHWIWKATTVLADGTKGSGMTTIEISGDGDIQTLVGTNQVRGDEELPESRSVWHRVSRRSMA